MLPPPTAATDRCVGRHYVFRSSVRESVRACVLLARYLITQWREFHQTLVDDVVEAENDN